MNLLEIRKKSSNVIIAISLVAISGLFVNLANVITIFLPLENKMALNLVLYFFACILGLILLPYLYVKKVLYNTQMPVCNINKKRLIILLFIILIAMLVSDERLSLAHNLIIATSEELLFRYIIMSVLITSFSKKKSFLIGSLIFSVILHMNGDFFINFITKFPAGLLLYYLTDKHGIQDAIFLHWFYNTVIGFIINYGG